MTTTWMLGVFEAWSLQVGVLVLILWAALAVLARRAPRVRLAAWQAALVTSLLLPMAAWMPAGAQQPLSVAAQSPLLAVLPAASVVPGRSAIDWPACVLAALVTGAIVRALLLAGGWIALGRRVRRGREVASPVFEEIRSALGAAARLRWSASESRPFTTGLRPADVVLPRSLATAPPRVLRAVLTHELLHVARGDWRWVVVEEVFRAVLWFHPAAWLLVAEARQAREEVVDRAVVERLGSRRDYMTTLLDFAEAPESRRLGPVLSFFRARQLARRIAALATGGPMSKGRLVTTSLLAFAVAGTAVIAAGRAFPTPRLASAAVPGAAGGSEQAGPLEQKAYTAPKDAPPPRRIGYKPPLIPADGLRPGESALFGIRLVVDASGRVAEARVLTADVKGTSGGHHEQRDVTDRLSEPVLSAVRQWTFEPPQRAPLAMTTAITIESPAKEADRESEVSTGFARVTEGPMAVTIPNASYPEAAKAAGVQGEVEVEVTVDPSGHVLDVMVTKSVAGLDDAAVAAAKASTFRPGIKDGKPVPVVVTLTFAFRLK